MRELKRPHRGCDISVVGFRDLAFVLTVRGESALVHSGEALVKL